MYQHAGMSALGSILSERFGVSGQGTLLASLAALTASLVVVRQETPAQYVIVRCRAIKMRVHVCTANTQCDLTRLALGWGSFRGVDLRLS